MKYRALPETLVRAYPGAGGGYLINKRGLFRICKHPEYAPILKASTYAGMQAGICTMYAGMQAGICRHASRHVNRIIAAWHTLRPAHAGDL